MSNRKNQTTCFMHYRECKWSCEKCSVGLCERCDSFGVKGNRYCLKCAEESGMLVRSEKVEIRTKNDSSIVGQSNLFKKVWVLVLGLLGLQIILTLSVRFLFDVLSLKTPDLTYLSVVAAMIIGQFYSKKYKEIMPKKIRLKVVLSYFVIQLFLSFCLIFSPNIFGEKLEGGSIAIVLTIMIFLNMFISLLMYWVFGFSGKIYIKKLEKQKAV